MGRRTDGRTDNMRWHYSRHAIASMARVKTIKVCKLLVWSSPLAVEPCITCHPAQLNALHLKLSQAGWYSIYLPRRDGRLSWPGWLVMHREWFTCLQTEASRYGRLDSNLTGSQTHDLVIVSFTPYRYSTKPPWVVLFADRMSMVRTCWLQCLQFWMIILSNVTRQPSALSCTAFMLCVKLR